MVEDVGGLATLRPVITTPIEVVSIIPQAPAREETQEGEIVEPPNLVKMATEHELKSLKMKNLLTRTPSRMIAYFLRYLKISLKLKIKLLDEG